METKIISKSATLRKITKEKEKRFYFFCLLWKVTKLGKTIEIQIGKSGASYLFHRALTRSDSYSIGLASWGLLKNHESKNDCITNGLSLIPISVLPWDCLHYENVKCTSLRFLLLLDFKVFTLTTSFPLPGVSKSIFYTTFCSFSHIEMT